MAIGYQDKQRMRGRETGAELWWGKDVIKRGTKGAERGEDRHLPCCASRLAVTDGVKGPAQLSDVGYGNV